MMNLPNRTELAAQRFPSKTANRLLIGLLAVIAACHLMVAQSVQSTTQSSIEPSAHLSDFQAVEFRRYTIKQGEREHFAQYFDTYFPESAPGTRDNRLSSIRSSRSFFHLVSAGHNR